jgi:hypothetical protein
MARTAWRFVDPETLDEYIWPVNPNNDSGSNSRNKSVDYASNAAFYQNSQGQHTLANVINVSAVEQQPFSYDGFVYNVDQYNALVEWSNKKYPVELYDDLGRGSLVYIKNFTLQRVRSRQNPFKHSYTISGIILGEI